MFVRSALRCVGQGVHLQADTRAHEVVTERTEIRVLGGLRVRRADGSFVDSRAWRTGKTADLVRLLAVRSRETVPVDTLLEALWPDVDEEHGRASLRTAVAQVRRVLGQDSVERRFGGLVLRGVWVDAVAFGSLAREARRLAAAGQPARLVTVTREAEALYLGEFRAHNDRADWALAERDALAGAYRSLLLDAADAAVELGWMRDAVEFATRSLADDPCSERASRALMLGYDGVGETSRALREFERCRVALADELGVDPSAPTRAVHVKLLAADPVEPVASPFIGRDDMAQRLRSNIEASLTARRPAVVMVTGVPGSGKSRLISEACQGISARQVRVPVAGRRRRVDCVGQLAQALGLPSTQSDSGQLEQAIASHEPLLVIMEDAELVQAASLHRLYTILANLEGAVTVVLDDLPADLENVCTDLLAMDKKRTDRRLFRIDLQPLRSQEVARLARTLLGGDTPPQLLDALMSETQGLPGRIVATVQGWLRAGRVAATAQGLVLMPEGEHRMVAHSAHQMLAPVLDQLAEGDLAVLQMMAVVGESATPSMIGSLLADADAPPDPARVDRQVQSSFELLVDLSVLKSEPTGYVFRDILFCDAVRSWLRPSSRQSLHRRVAEHGYIYSEQRVGHWLSAGEPLLARAAALEASGEAMSDGRYEDARALLMRICSLGGMVEAPPENRVDLHEKLGDVCATLRRADEARAAYAVAAGVSRAHGLPDLERLTAKQDGVSADNGTEHETSATSGVPPEQAGVDTDQLVPDGDAVFSPELEQSLLAQLEEADRQGDPQARAGVRLQLAAEALPRRDFEGSHVWTQEALSITVIPALRARAIHQFWLPGALLGHAAFAEGPLRHARDLADDCGDAVLTRRLTVLSALVAHDLGRPQADQLVRAAAASADCDDDYWPWVSIRVATERGALHAAQLAAKQDLPQRASPAVRQMRDLATAALRAELGKVSEAMDLLRSVIDAGTTSGHLLLLPEAIARLISLEASTDLAAAREHFELLDWAAGGDHRFPRENCLRLLARAAVRAATGQFDAAAVAAANAADVAENSTLPFLAAQAHRARAAHLAAAGHWSQAQLAEGAAHRFLRAAAPPSPGPFDPSRRAHIGLPVYARGWTMENPQDLIRGAPAS